MPKEDCKYWDKCYQRNEYHLQKYNHPKVENENKEDDAKTKEAPKRTSSGSANEDVDLEKKAKSESSDEEIDTTELRAEVLNNIAGKNYMEILQERIRKSVQKEYEDLLGSNEFIRHKFLVEMPTDFYDFWKFVKGQKKDATGEELLIYFSEKYQLELVGPFEFLGERFNKARIYEPGDYLRHWRFFYDPPEFQTVFVRRGTGIHYGYWRDTPQDKENLLIARNDASKDCEFELIAGNAFDAFLYYLEKDYPSTPFTTGAVANIKKSVHHYIETNNLKLNTLETLQKERNKKVVTKTFHRCGIVVPYEGKTQLGYRTLIVSDAELKKILKLFEGTEKTKKSDDTDDNESDKTDIKRVVMEKLQPIATAANIALDECDFGTSLELGTDLFCSGRVELHMLAQSLLVPAYTLLNRPQFIAISKAHMERRQKSLKLSIFDK